MINFIAENSYVFFKKRSDQSVLQTTEAKEYFANLPNIFSSKIFARGYRMFQIKRLYSTVVLSLLDAATL